MAKNTYKQDEILEEPFDIRHLLRASSYNKKYRRGMILAIVLSGIGGAFGYVAPMIIQRALDIAVPDKNMRLLFSLVATLIAIYVVSVIFTTIRSRIMVDVSQNIIYDIRKDLFEHLQELPFLYYDDRPHGKILIRVVNYVNSVSDMLSNGLINIVLEAFNLLIFDPEHKDGKHGNSTQHNQCHLHIYHKHKNNNKQQIKCVSAGKYCRCPDYTDFCT